MRALIDEVLSCGQRKGFADNIAVIIAFLSQDGTPSLGSFAQPLERGLADPSMGSTSYHKETLPGGATIEEYTVTFLDLEPPAKRRKQ